MNDESIIEVDSSRPGAEPTNSPRSPATDPAALIKAIAGGGVDPISALLSQLGAQPDNPMASVLTALLQARRPAAAENDPSLEQAPNEEQIAAQQERERSLLELNETVTRLYGELETLRKRNDEVAAGLGACFLCFGSDPLCPECGGRGRPGTKLPEPGAYRKYVLPALGRVQKMQQTRAQVRSVPTPPSSASGVAADIRAPVPGP
jgi:hypothetical protein